MDLPRLLFADAVKRSVRAMFARAGLSTVHPITHFDGVVVSDTIDSSLLPIISIF